jgi:hypothetical protein
LRKAAATLKKVLLCSLTAFSLVPASAEEAYRPACQVPEGALAVSWEKDVPPAVAQALKKAAGEGDISPPGGPFNAIGVMDGRPGKRVMFAWRSGSRWAVATEQGGFVYYNRVFAFDPSAEPENVALAEERDARPSTLCETAVSLLDGQPKHP